MSDETATKIVNLLRRFEALMQSHPRPTASESFTEAVHDLYKLNNQLALEKVITLVFSTAQSRAFSSVANVVDHSKEQTDHLANWVMAESLRRAGQCLYGKDPMEECKLAGTECMVDQPGECIHGR